ncbi:MAG: phage tail-type lysozyme domain-containing protein, partial [Streptococcaceae bacterium]|nr:phage tail-type lysozyme domain-containing protein [Streptococcaceae bacterium]
PSLYYSSVDYQEEVELLASKETESSVVERAVQVYSRLKSQGFSTVGISAILGNFQIESGINPKRAEGDYLAPPVGAFKGCWDDDSWLEMGSAEIYGGKFPLIRHRGLGLGQWTDTTDGSNRALMLRTYAKERGEKWYNLDLQLDFILNGDSPIRSKIFKDVASISKLEQLEEATKTFLTFWEGNPLDKIELRISASRDWFFYFSQTEQSPTFNPLDAYLWAEKRIFPMPTKKEIETGWEGNGYAPGHCTWYVFNRMRQFGKHIHPFMGNAADWTENYKLTHGAKLAIQPIVGDAVIFEPGVQGSSTLYGHVAFVEHVFSEGNFLISEMNVNGIFTMRWRVVGIEKGVHFMRVVSGVE